MMETADTTDGKLSKQTGTTSDQVSFYEAFCIWLKIGLLSFGGPAGQIALMHRLLVEEKKWIDENRFLHALNYCMLLPGPEAQQLTVYVGWLLHGIRGGLVAGILFVLPGAIVIMALSALYAGYGELSAVQAIFFGVKAAVLAVVIGAVRNLASKVLKNGAMVTIAGMSFVGIYFLGLPFPMIVISAAVVGFFGGMYKPRTFAILTGHDTNDDGDKSVVGKMYETHQGSTSMGSALKTITVCLILWFGPIAGLAYFMGIDNVFTQEAAFFSKMAVVTFGGAYAVLAYMAQAAVETYGWLMPGEMLDGLGMAETTPGPLIMVTQFVGFLGAFRNPGSLDPMLAGVIGASLTVWVTFVPCFLWIFLGAPYVERLRQNVRLSSALSAVTAAVVGVILNLAVWFGLNVVFGKVDKVDYPGFQLFTPDISTLDSAALGLSLFACIAMLAMRFGMMTVLAASAALGFIIQTWVI
jgi:chromate transporter